MASPRKMAPNTIVSVMMAVAFVALVSLTIAGFMTGDVLGVCITGILGIGTPVIGWLSQDNTQKNQEIDNLKAQIEELKNSIGN